jgi:hypothetical protein
VAPSDDDDDDDDDDKRYPYTGLDKPQGLQEFEVSRILENRLMKVEKSALRSGLLRPQEDAWYSFLLETESTLGSYFGRED